MHDSVPLGWQIKAEREKGLAIEAAVIEKEKVAADAQVEHADSRVRVAKHAR